MRIAATTSRTSVRHAITGTSSLNTPAGYAEVICDRPRTLSLGVAHDF